MTTKNKFRKFLSAILFSKKDHDRLLSVLSIVLAMFGVFMTTSITVGMVDNTAELVIYLCKQIVFLIIGIMAMNYMSNRFMLSFFEKYKLFISLSMMMLLIIPLFFPSINGAKAWVQLPLGITFQPSEFFKVYVIVLIGLCVEYTKTRKVRFTDAFRPLFLFGGAGIFIIAILQKDFGSALMTLLISLLLIVIPYHRNFIQTQKKLLIIGGVCVILGLFFLTNFGLDLIIKLLGGTNSDSYQVLRFVAARNPFLDAQGSGLQLIYGLEAIAKGGFFGVGVGKSTIKYLIPEGRTDYVLTIIIEESGILGFIMLSLIIMGIIARLIYFALHSKNESYKVILIGVALYFGLHYIFNVGGVSGLIPLTGIPLLMVSSGGTSLVAVFLGLGVCQAIIPQIKKDMIKRNKL